MLHILIADDHEVTRRGLKEILRDEYGQLHVEETADAAALLRKIPERKWDLVLLDIVMPGMNVIDALAQIRALRPKLPVLILTAIGEMEFVIRTLKAGANGYISKQHASQELILAVKKVLAGETFLSSDAVSMLAENLRGESKPQPHHSLSEREMQVFRLIARGRAIKEIASELDVSDKTIGTYLARIKEKTGLVSYVEIARYALQNRIVD